MVQYRVKDDWASYNLPRTPPSKKKKKRSFGLTGTAQWQTWLRHGREDPPSLQELVEDSQRRRRTRELAARIDEEWHQLSSEGGAEKVGIASSDEALKGKPFEDGTLRVAFEEGPAEMLRNLPGKDPGAKFEPTAWTGSVKQRGEDMKGKDQVKKVGEGTEKQSQGEWTGKVAER